MVPALFLPAALASASSTMISALPERFATATEDPDELGATGQIPEALRPSPDVIRGAVDPRTLTGAGPPIEVPEGPLGIPEPMLFAYVDGARELSDTTPGCGVDWAVLASIGRIESAHARSGDIDVNGTTVSAILGPRLNGGPGIAAIRDTDNAFHDGDPVWDRAVGPMQFIPSTWSRYAIDGNNDLVASPHNVHDSVTAAGNYLCAAGTDLRDPENLATAVFTYNQSDSYVREVLIWADAYRRGVNPLPTELAPPDERDVLAGERLPEESPDVLAEPQAPQDPDVEAAPPLPELDEAVPPLPDVDGAPEGVPPADQPPEPPLPDTGLVPPASEPGAPPPDAEPPAGQPPQLPSPGKGDSVPPREQPSGEGPGSEAPPESNPGQQEPPTPQEPEDERPAPEQPDGQHPPDGERPQDPQHPPDPGEGLPPPDPQQPQDPQHPGDGQPDTEHPPEPQHPPDGERPQEPQEPGDGQQPDGEQPDGEQPDGEQPDGEQPEQPQIPEHPPEPQLPEPAPQPDSPGSVPPEEESPPQPMPPDSPEQAPAPEPTEPPLDDPTQPPSEDLDVVACDDTAISEGRFTTDQAETFDGPIPANHTPPEEATPGTWISIDAPTDSANRNGLAQCQIPPE